MNTWPETAMKPAVSATPPLDGQTDADLLECIRNGSPEAVATLIDRYYERIHSLALAILRNAGDAHDASQDVFLSIVRRVGAYRGDAALYPRMCRICVHRCLLLLRGRRRGTPVSIEDFLPAFTADGRHSAGAVDDWSFYAKVDALNLDLGEVLWEFTESLPDIDRVMFVLSDVEDFDHDEIAGIVGLTVQAVESRLRRGRLYLRERLARYLRTSGTTAPATLLRRPRSE